MVLRREREINAGDARTAVFFSDFGWFCIATQAGQLCELTFGHETPDQAFQAASHTRCPPGKADAFTRGLIARLQAFARRPTDEFLDVKLDLDGFTEFQRAVVECCRRVRLGETTTYGELARRAGRPRAARAVGHVMATNRFPLIVPCHRVLGSNGSLGGYSARDGLHMKCRLLRHEGTTHPALCKFEATSSA